jgi:hypothetical protein
MKNSRVGPVICKKYRRKVLIKNGSNNGCNSLCSDQQGFASFDNTYLLKFQTRNNRITTRCRNYFNLPELIAKYLNAP